MILPVPDSTLIMSQLDLNEEDHQVINYQFCSPNHQYASSTSISSLSYPNLFYPPDQYQQRFYYTEPNNLPNHHEKEFEKIIPSIDSWDHSAVENYHSKSKLSKLTVWKQKEETRDDENVQAADQDGSSSASSMKWMSSKMRIMRKMMVSDQTAPFHVAASKFEDKKQPLSTLGTDNSSSNIYSNNHSNNNNTVRVCSDCHTTKTPLWRSGPRGPKTLCNACGIRQRKARSAMEAAASANGTNVKRNKFENKEKKSKTELEPHMNKKKHKFRSNASSQSRSKKFGFEDLRLSLSKNMAVQQVFPQDEREAAILLMALSYGLVC